MIYLRATHAELTKAGFANLDPKHELFLLYREKDDALALPDLSIVAPKPSHSSPRWPGVRRSPCQGRDWDVHVIDKPLKVRRGISLTSKRAGTLAKGSKIRVLDSRTWHADGTQRVCVAAADSEEGAAPQILPLGWVTAKLPRSAVPPSRPSASVFFSTLEC